MKANRTWQGVRMRRVMAGADAEAPVRQITLPAAWEDTAAEALAALAPGDDPIALAVAAEAWVRPIAARALRAGIKTPLPETLHRMLLLRRGAPQAAVWHGSTDQAPGFVLNLSSFHDPALGFDAPAFAEAVESAVIALTLHAPAAPQLAIGFSDLAGLF